MLKTVLESLEGVDDAVKPLYAETEAGFVLQIDGIDSHPDVANLKRAYERVKTDKTTLASERDALQQRIEGLPEDFDPKKWEQFKKGGQADPEELVQLRQTLEAERDEWKGKFETLAESNRKRAVQDAVSAALSEQGVPETLRKGAALAMLDGKKVELQGDTPTIETDMGPMALSDYAKRWAAGEGKGYVAPPKGGDAKGKERGAVGKPAGKLGGDRSERIQALRERFPDLPS